MKRPRNRFDWIARGWIALGFCEFPFVFLIFYANVLLRDWPPIPFLLIHILGISILTFFVVMIIVSFMLIDRKWAKLNRIGAVVVAWGLAHTAIAIAFLAAIWIREIPPNPDTVDIQIILSSIGAFLILSGLYVIFFPGIYQRDRAERLAKKSKGERGT